jgi:hypothetical protein
MSKSIPMVASDQGVAYLFGWGQLGGYFDSKRAPKLLAFKNTDFYDKGAINMLHKRFFFSYFLTPPQIRETASRKHCPNSLSLGCLRKISRGHLGARGHMVGDYRHKPVQPHGVKSAMRNF